MALDPYPLLFRHLLTRIEAERAHGLGLSVLRGIGRGPRAARRALRRRCAPADPRLQVELWGLSFANPIGVAAGMDKDAEAVAGFAALGFGHVEVGTVTPRPQPGNERPRIWRFPERRALVNALGFPSVGAAVVARRLRSVAKRLGGESVVGVNLGKNADTPLSRAHEDYVRLVEQLFDVADYFTINISSPNTPRLRELQLGESLRRVVEATATAVRRVAASRGQAPRPLLVKVAPDLSDERLEQVAEAVVLAGGDGIIATNTTTSREGLPPRARSLPGGLSGEPLRQRARQVIRRLHATVGGRLPIVGVGGVADAEDVLGHVRAGASLVQLYSGLVYGGPLLAARLVAGLRRAADREGWRTVSELVGDEAT